MGRQKLKGSSMKILVSLSAIAVALSAGTAIAGGHLPLEVADQSATTQVVISSVSIDVDGFVTIHGSNENGGMIAPASLGHTYLSAGQHSDVAVDLATAVASGTTLYAMLHIDDGTKMVYEFGTDTTEFDGPYMHDGGAVVAPFSIQ